MYCGIDLECNKFQSEIDALLFPRLQLNSKQSYNYAIILGELVQINSKCLKPTRPGHQKINYYLF